MSNERWLRLKALHELVFELPLPEARKIVEHEFSDDPDLASELISLLEQKLERTRFLKLDGARVQPSIFPPHHRLGDYELLHQIGSGGMGIVYLARHLPLERIVALKVLNTALSARPDQVDRFRREAQRLARFKHPGIVPIYDVQSMANVHFFAMEYVDGLDLHRELVCLRGALDSAGNRCTLPAADSKDYFRTVAEIVRQAADALADAHEHKITHRDIKPHNLILGRDGRLRIVDFGIARDEAMGLAPGSEDGAGTLYYMSPEQARVTRDRIVDHRTDIYSLGVVLYELLTLRRPFEGETQREILKAIELRDEKPVRDLNPRVPRDLAVICQKAMEKTPSSRYMGAREFAADLQRFRNGESILATPPTALDLTLRILRRRRVPLGAGALTSVALFGGFFLRERFAADPNSTTLTVRYTGPAGELAPTGLSYQSFDPITERFGERTELGAAPFSPANLPVGFVRLWVGYPEGQFGELSRFLRPGSEEVQVELAVRRSARGSSEGMVLIGGGLLARRKDPRRTLCSNLGQDISVEPFLLDAREVTVAQYREFLRETGRPRPERWSLYGDDPLYDQRPVVSLSHPDMQAYAEYHGKRLPTHAEWELAARGAEERLTPSGAPLDLSLRAAIHGEAPRQTLSHAERIELWKQHTRDVGTSPEDVTPDGIFDLLGNVREATESAFVHVLAVGGVPQVMPDAYWNLGGAWYSNSQPSGLDAHGMDGTGTPGDAEIGFRCARSFRQ